MIDPLKYSKNIIIGNGEYPKAQFPLSIIENATFVACCDGAANTYINLAKIPDLIIGDGDSISTLNASQYKSIFIKSDDQETNDQTKAVNHLHALGLNEISILAATGLREDHTLGNISLLIEYASHGINARIYTDTGVFFVVDGSKTIKSFHAQQISIFNFTATQISASGLKYQIYPFTNWWQGTLNQAQDQNFKITTNAPTLIYATYNPKT
ncbi:MAG: thiamine diphosphokinase [Muribaculaceae bacterium]|nr:thiamine diphosphokinase [Muribaculaceae bacterium]